MGLFSKITNTVKAENRAGNVGESIVLAPSFHMAEDEIYGDETDDGGYCETKGLE